MKYRSEQLAELATEQPQLATTIAVYQDIVSAQERVNVHLPPTLPSPEAIQAQIDSGQPVIHLCVDACDWPAIVRLASTICERTARHQPPLQHDLRILQTWLSAAGATALQAFLLETDFAAPKLQDLSLLSFVLDHAYYPWLYALARALGPLPTYEHWQRGNCPLCGGEPDLAYLHPQTGLRHLICARCDSDWAFQRLECPFCGETSEGQRYFVDDRSGRRLYLCPTCGRYLKTIDRRVTWKRYTPLVERIRTLDMDMAVRDHLAA